jgi:Holliday junction resolvase-like predicted endonuclease
VSAVSKGHGRERKLRKVLEAEGWIVFAPRRALGVCDLVALRRGSATRFIEVKSNEAGGPYSNFRWRDRADLLEAAELAGG